MSFSRRFGTRRGTGRGSNSKAPSSGPTPAQLFRALFTGNSSWFDADSYVDGGGGLCSGLVDHIDPTHLLANALGPSQCVLPTADALYAGKNSLRFTGAQYYVSNRPASAWRSLHDGTGSTHVFVWATTLNSVLMRPWGTIGATGAGGQLYLSIGTPGVAATNTAGSLVFNGSENNGHFANTVYLVVRRFKSTSTPNWSFSRGATLKASGAQTATPSAVDSLASFTLGASGVLNDFASMRFRAAYNFTYELTTPQLQTVFDYILADCGVPA